MEKKTCYKIVRLGKKKLFSFNLVSLITKATSAITKYTNVKKDKIQKHNEQIIDKIKNVNAIKNKKNANCKFRKANAKIKNYKK
jgi:hypothetical protein